MRRRALLLSCALLLALGLVAPAAAQSVAGVAAGSTDYDERYRPQFHYSPAQNWMNDPNGLVYYQGEYHLFYQYNPEGDTWGNISWGHAVSTDLVHWEELPVALPYSSEEFIFSGGVVVDTDNTSGFGTAENPAMVAIYTSFYPQTGVQAQSLAYSLDRGRTWTKYAGNPVLDIGSRDFRDPKVFWYAPGDEWIMAVALSAEHKVSFYSSTDLKSWTHLSDFGPANAVGGLWEVPDLFPLPLDGKQKRQKWVLIVNINPGSIAGGSGAQYFVGEFDGTTFTADNAEPYTPPAGEVFADFEGGEYAPGWTTTGTAFGDGPAQGTLPGQQPVSGYEGDGLVNSFIDFDSAQGTLTSPAFTIGSDYINFLVGGGAHQWSPDAGDGLPPADSTVFADFEGSDFGDWTATGNAFGPAPSTGNAPCQGGVSGFLGDQLANSFHNGDPLVCDDPPDGGTGSLISPDFTIAADGKNFINFLVGGGAHPDTAVRLFVDGTADPVLSTSGKESETLNWASWDVSPFAGQTGRIEVLDGNTGGWGHVLVDHVIFSSEAAKPRSTETSVNLVVDGEVVRHTSGEEGETLDWASWNVADLQGRDAQIQIVDRNSGGWGHILADHIMFADEPATSSKQRASWLDYGRDNYAVVTYNDAPGGERISVGWMNNWQYANQIPTDPWRSAMTVPRELSLQTVDGEPRLVQQPVDQLEDLRLPAPYRVRTSRIPDGVTTLTGRRSSGDTLEIQAEFKARDADQFGVKVRVGDGEETVIGYDVAAGEVYLDRTRSGDVGFSPAFAGVERAPLPAKNGEVTLRILVDRSSVEVFADGGRRVITDQIFPAPTSQGVAVFSAGGQTKLKSMTIWQLESAWR